MCTKRKATGYYVLAWFMFATMGVWCIAIGATPVMDTWMHERHCVAGIGTSIKICEIGLL